MKELKLLLTGAYNWKNEHFSKLEELGFEIMFSSREDTPLSPEHYDAEAVICNWLFVNHDIKKFHKLKYIQLLSAGMDRVNLNYIQEKNISIHNARGVYSIPMAEYAVCAVLQIYKGSLGFYENQINHNWKKNRGLKELTGERVCIVGAGSVGSEVARLFSAFTNEVYGIDLYPNECSFFKEIYPIECLDVQIALSDVVILTLPLTNSTRNIFDQKRFSIMKEKAVFVNMSRGELVDEKALLWALDNKLYGAAIDVFSKEPLSQNSEMWGKKNLIITPHNSFVSTKNDDRLWNLIIGNFTEYKSKFDI